MRHTDAGFKFSRMFFNSNSVARTPSCGKSVKALLSAQFSSSFAIDPGEDEEAIAQLVHTNWLAYMYV